MLSFFSQGCAEGWIAFKHYCYRHFPGKRPWYIAESVCIEANGHLPIVQSDEESAFLTKSFPNQNFWVGVGDCMCGKKCTVDYSKVGYSNWDTCEPKDLDEAEGCALLVKNTGKWRNEDCKETQRTICKRGA